MGGARYGVCASCGLDHYGPCPPPLVIDMPGAFETFWTGTGVAQGQPWSTVPEEEAGARELLAAWNNRRTIKRGFGVTHRLILRSREAVMCLCEYAEANVNINQQGSAEEREYAELRAARRIIEQCEELREELGW